MTLKMIVYHGTGNYNLDGFKKAPIKRARHYLGWRKAFSTTTKFDVAALFALRHTSPDAIFAGKISGVVLEFELSGVQGKDYIHAKDDCLQNEFEIAVFNVGKLTILGVWQFDGEWKQQPLY